MYSNGAAGGAATGAILQYSGLLSHWLPCSSEAFLSCVIASCRVVGPLHNWPRLSEGAYIQAVARKPFH